MREQLHMLGSEGFVNERSNHTAGKKDSVGGDQPFRLIGHDDRGSVPGGKARILKRRGQWLSSFAKLPVGQPRTFALAVGLDQPDLFRPLVKRAAQRPAT